MNTLRRSYIASRKYLEPSADLAETLSYFSVETGEDWEETLLP